MFRFSQDCKYWWVVLNKAVDLDFIKFVIALTIWEKSVVFQTGRFSKEMVICFLGELQYPFNGIQTYALRSWENGYFLKDTLMNKNVPTGQGSAFKSSFPLLEEQ